MIPDRKSLIESGRINLTARKAEYELELSRLDEAAATETKSSAGDKYETGREMISQARMVLERNLSKTQLALDVLQRMSLPLLGSKIGFGSLVGTDSGWFLVGTSLGELESNGFLVQTISLASPLGQALKGQQAGDTIPWKSGEIHIRQIIC